VATMTSKYARVLAALQRAGSRLELPHPLRHYLYVPDRPSAESAVASLRGEGFDAKVERAALGDQWLVLATHKMIPSLDAITAIRTRFEKLASGCNGEYDGWEAGITRT